VLRPDVQAPARAAEGLREPVALPRLQADASERLEAEAGVVVGVLAAQEQTRAEDVVVLDLEEPVRTSVFVRAALEPGRGPRFAQNAGIAGLPSVLFFSRSRSTALP